MSDYNDNPWPDRLKARPNSLQFMSPFSLREKGKNMSSQLLKKLKFSSVSATVPDQKRLRLCVDISYLDAAMIPELLNVSCRRLSDSEFVPRESMSSGYSGDVSKASSTSPNFRSLPLLPEQRHRVSQMSSNSSHSNVPSSAAAISNINAPQLDTVKLTNDRLEHLLSSWKNGNLVFSLLDKIDTIRTEQINREREVNGNADELFHKEVYARFEDKFYYAVVTQIFANNEVEVTFINNSTKVVHRINDIRTSRQLVGKPVTVYMKHNPPTYTKGLLVDMSMELFSCDVLTDHVDINTAPDNLYFTDIDQTSAEGTGASALSGRNVFYFDIDKPNLVITPVAQPVVDEGIEASCSGFPTRGANAPASHSSDSEDEKKAWIPGCDIESQNSHWVHSPATSTLKRKRLPNNSVVGSLDFTGDWFADLSFVITSPESEECVVYDTKIFSESPFIPNRLIKQIELAGGQTFETFSEIPMYRNAILVSWGPCLTPNYIKALALGIKIVSHQWVIDCSNLKLMLPFQLLPAGWSVTQNRFISIDERNSSTPFAGLKILVCGGPNFTSFWLDICHLLGGTTSQYQYNLSANFIVVEDSINLNVSDNQRDAPLVSTSWVIECLVLGRLCYAISHSTFKPT